ncbi:glycoside hydrolase family 88 protein [Candidatus Enterococcus clewellii]|uniref:Unsaturated chondroitin disaccharide hydrolase n=1 Tax=Candidatus Enterococcus clewellii TaxID=1834193 RepID=A0A242K8L8_9ENTE|nr:glycoside hydrolase family 88 protein [Enterococcus sp. 9E7_DIV0242]OTP17514.1 hypothetical protein A5888_001652 [Enterococcus sp. 9E7_DIV0242]
MNVELDTETWSELELKKVAQKVKWEINRIGDGIPYQTVRGKYSDQGLLDISWWTNGFWGGINWQLYSYFGEDIYRKTAESVEERLDQALVEFEHLHHDVGFMWLLTSVVNYKLFKDQRSYQRSIHVATALAGRFNIEGKFLRAWNKEQTEEDCSGWVIIDSMMNIPLLFWASEELQDPRFSKIAEAHAETVATHLIRPDGSTSHIGIFDSSTGEFIRAVTGQGYSENSAWARGQGWAIYGFALCYKYTKNIQYLDIAKKCAHFTIANLGLSNFLARIDFRAPLTSDDRDASASAIIACGLLEIAEHVSAEEKSVYQLYGIKILKRLAEIADYEKIDDGIIANCAVQYHEESGKNSTLIYADSFYIEGLLKLLNADISLW